jgi:hypothetical protein
MTQWQFLIQKERDQDWLPLDSPGAEILEGSYRLVAQVDHEDVVVEIQIRHEYEVDGILQEIVQRRVQHVSGGQIELLSSTYLLPGLWQLSCQLMSDREDLRTFRSTLALQVLAQEFELLSEWEPADELQKILTVPISHPITATLHPTPQERQEEKDTVSQSSPQVVSLPSIPKESPQITLCVSEKLRLPPLIYTPTEGADTQVPLDLPNFLPLNAMANDAESETEQISYLEFLRRFAKSRDRHAVHEAFESLVWRQRFWQTLNTLATVTSPTMVSDESLAH